MIFFLGNNCFTPFLCINKTCFHISNGICWSRKHNLEHDGDKRCVCGVCSVQCVVCGVCVHCAVCAVSVVWRREWPEVVTASEGSICTRILQAPFFPEKSKCTIDMSSIGCMWWSEALPVHRCNETKKGVFWAKHAVFVRYGGYTPFSVKFSGKSRPWRPRGGGYPFKGKFPWLGLLNPLLGRSF